MSMQQYITGLLLVSTLCAAALSHPPHPYTAEFPKRILLEHLARCDNGSQVHFQPSLSLHPVTEMSDVSLTGAKMCAGYEVNEHSCKPSGANY